MHFITISDYLLLPIYLVIIYVIANNFKNRHYPPGHPWRKYFMPALNVKIYGAIFIGLVYQYYYGGGDTANYFKQSVVINEAFLDNPYKGIMLILHIPDSYDPDLQLYLSRLKWYNAKNNFFVIAVGGLANTFTFATFLPTSVLFACLCFSGMWAMFRTFAVQYPMYVRQIAVAVLFIPSCFIWGSGIFKDTLCMFSLGWLTYAVFQVLVQRNLKISNLVVAVASFLTVVLVKIYIILSFLPALGLWVVFMYSHKIKSSVLRFFMKMSLVAATILGFYLLSDKFAADLGGYSLDKIVETAEVTRDYILRRSGDEGSGYDIGIIDPSLFGMLKVFPKALTIALYGPFLWQAKKVFVLMNSLEATLFLLLSIRILLRLGLKRVWTTISGDPNIQFFLVFTLIFGFAVGLTSGNYGALSRYRIPCLPMFGLALLLIYYKGRKDARMLLPILKF